MEAPAMDTAVDQTQPLAGQVARLRFPSGTLNIMNKGICQLYGKAGGNFGLLELWKWELMLMMLVLG
jgi:hypothetical protein